MSRSHIGCPKWLCSVCILLYVMVTGINKITNEHSWNPFENKNIAETHPEVLNAGICRIEIICRVVLQICTWDVVPILFALLSLCGILQRKPHLLLPHIIWNILFVIGLQLYKLYVEVKEQQNKRISEIHLYLFIFIEGFPIVIQIFLTTVIYSQCKRMAFENRERRKRKTEETKSQRQINELILNMETFFQISEAESKHPHQPCTN